MKLEYSGTTAMCKWLKVDFPRLPTEPGKQPGVNSIISSSEQMCWQLHIIENEYRSWHKTIIATEAFLGVRPSKTYRFFIILSPVGSYFPEGIQQSFICYQSRILPVIYQIIF